MKKTYNVLIIDDHPAIVDGFKNALNFITRIDDYQYFQVETAFDSETAYHIIMDRAMNNFDLVILDIRLPPCKKLKIDSGEDLGELVRNYLPKAKILVCTFYLNKLRLQHIHDRLKPEGFVCKTDVDISGLATAVQNVLKHDIYYSRTIVKTLKQRSFNDFQLDQIDLSILIELSNGSKMKDLVELMPISKSAIDKRIRSLKQKLNIDSFSTRDLILKAKRMELI